MSLIIETDGPVLVVTMDRAKARNAVDPAQAERLREAFDSFERNDEAKVAVFTGANGVFCAGYDLKSFADRKNDEAKKLDYDPEGEGPMGPSRRLLAKPVIAAVEGHAVAGGLELALWCDMRVASETAVFGVFCRRWGVPLIDGGTVRLPRLVGQGRANDLILTGRGVAAAEAQAMGLADRVTPAGGALAAALALAHSLARFPQACLRADFLSARMAPADLAAALRREWASAGVVLAEGIAGATRFARGAGRGGRFDD